MVTATSLVVVAATGLVEEAASGLVVVAAPLPGGGRLLPASTGNKVSPNTHTHTKTGLA